MKDRVESTGTPSIEELKEQGLYPSPERFAKGPMVLVECVQEIPCNPCETGCAFGAIKVGEPITNIPVILEDLCTGCGLCIAKCPGLAIFIVDKTYSDTTATVSFPHEYVPLPGVGDVVNGVNRNGEVITQARVLKITDRGSFDKTPVIMVEIPLELADEVRGIQPLQRGESHE